MREARESEGRRGAQPTGQTWREEKREKGAAGHGTKETVPELTCLTILEKGDKTIFYFFTEV